MPRGQNLIVGLTGGMGCGKSTAAGLFAAQGFQRHDSDRHIRDVLYADPDVITALVERLGPAVVGPDGAVRRERVAERVFADDAALAWLEDLLHPRLLAHWRRLFATGGPWIVEVPLLFEKGLENWFDFTVCVTAHSAVQLQRLEHRGMPAEAARRRLARQMPLARKCELADFVLLNDGTLEFLREQVESLSARLRGPEPTL